MRNIVFKDTVYGISVEHVIRDYLFTMPAKHFHDEYELYYLKEGDRFYFIENQSYHITAGTVVLVNKNQVHKTACVNDPYHNRILIEFRAEPFQNVFSCVSNINLCDTFDNIAGIISLDEKGCQYVEQALFRIMNEMHNKQNGYEMVVQLKLAELLIYLSRSKSLKAGTEASTCTTARHKKVDEVAYYISRNYTKPMSLESLAKQFYVNKCYLSRIFKSVTGFTVNEYINTQRIQAALQLLTETDYNISEIADKLGYESVTYFEKVFKSCKETTPLKYRKLYSTMKLPPRPQSKRAEELA